MSYILLSASATVLFFAAYWLLMRREKRHTMVRFYLLGTLFLSLLLPAIHLNITLPQHYVANGESSPATTITKIISQSGSSDVSSRSVPSSMPSISADESHSFAGPTVDAKHLVLIVWLTGCVATLALLVIRLAKLWHKLRIMPFHKVDGVCLTLLDDNTPAYSFGRHIVVGTKGFSENEVRQLFGHEVVHVRQGHTVDLLLCEVARVVLWFDPFVYLYLREIKRVHEYIADNEMMSADYAELFYHQVSGQRYSTLCNTFDYKLAHQRIAMMARQRSTRGWLKSLALVPLAVLVLVAACVPKGALSGDYSVGRITLLSDDPDELDLKCSEFMGLESRVFRFMNDGQMILIDRSGYGLEQHLTYKIDDDGLHLYDSSGKPWMNMDMETLHCDGDSIVVRFVDPDPVIGIGKILAGLPPYRYRIDTVEVSTPGKGPNGEPIDLNVHLKVDTSFAHVTAPCEFGHWHHNRLLAASALAMKSGVSQYTDTAGNTVEHFFTAWEFVGDVISPNANEEYNTYNNNNRSHIEDDRFILEVVLKKSDRK